MGSEVHSLHLAPRSWAEQGKIGLQENLSPTRANGLVSMIKQIKIYAMAYNN